jgi:hypothetical protein
VLNQYKSLQAVTKDLASLEMYKLFIGLTPAVLAITAVRTYPHWFVNMMIFMTSLCFVIFGVNPLKFND